MYSLETLNYLNDEAVKRARQAKRKPVFFNGDAEQFSVPYVGDRSFSGLKRVKTLFVDTSGWGGEHEPAMTQAQFLKQLDTECAYGVVEQGEFQCYVGVWKKK